MDLGDQCIAGAFSRSERPGMPEPKLPLQLVRCDPTGDRDACGLLQLRHTVPGLDPLQLVLVPQRHQPDDDREPARDRAQAVEAVGGLATGRPRDRHRLQRRHAARRLRGRRPTSPFLGIDPSDVTRYAVAKGYDVVNDFFATRALAERFPNRKARVVTSIAMFYDLEQPGDFVADIARCLATTASG